MIIEYCHKSKCHVASGHIKGRFVIAEATSSIKAFTAWVELAARAVSKMGAA